MSELYSEEMNSKSEENIFNNIAALMKRDGINAPDLSAKSGVSARYIYYIINRDRCPGPGIIDQLAKAFDLEGWQLMLPGLRVDTVEKAALNSIVSASMASKEARKVMESHADYLKMTHPSNDKKNPDDQKATG